MVLVLSVHTTEALLRIPNYAGSIEYPNCGGGVEYMNCGPSV